MARSLSTSLSNKNYSKKETCIHVIKGYKPALNYRHLYQRNITYIPI